ncbi:MAG: EVE domain-containing protein [Candidatus Delongbacteria bacterium]|nr:EVE domain-containing protein [Candidatus Delongbacteria bacterium]
MKAWLVNTNSNPDNDNENGFKFMLRQNKAASFYYRIEEIDVIKKGDLVLIYHNNNRIIAVGAVVEEEQKHDFDETHHIEHWADVNWLWKADFDGDKPLNSINRNDLGITKFRHTVEDITDQLNYKILFEKICERQKYL